MKSIRRRLTALLLGGLAILWLALGAGVYLAVHSSLIKTIDAELALDAGVVRFMVRGEEPDNPESTDDAEHRGGSRRLPERVPDYQQLNSGAYFQAWTSGGEPLERSPSLGSVNLPFTENTNPEPFFATTRIDDGRTLRTMAFQVAGGGQGRGKRPGPGRKSGGMTNVVLAKDLQPVNQTLSSLAGGLALIGLLAAAGAVIIVSTALGRGLKPLQELGAQSDAIDVTSLNARFNAGSAPAELQPVYTRLNDLMSRIQNSFDRERRFSSDLAHEMRTPLAELKMLSELALKWPDQAGPDSHREGLALATQLESMVTNLLALARWESGEAPLKNESVSLESVVNDCWKSYAPLAEEKKLRVQLNTNKAPVWQTDPGMLRHIIDNLLSNAVEYTPKGKQIAVFSHANALEIANAAPGLQPGDLEHLFDRYWRRDPARADSKHAGLGLSLAKACAQALNLDLSAQLENQTLRIFLTHPL